MFVCLKAWNFAYGLIISFWHNDYVFNCQSIHGLKNHHLSYYIFICSISHSFNFLFTIIFPPFAFILENTKFGDWGAHLVQIRDKSVFSLKPKQTVIALAENLEVGTLRMSWLYQAECMQVTYSILIIIYPSYIQIICIADHFFWHSPVKWKNDKQLLCYLTFKTWDYQ